MRTILSVSLPEKISSELEEYAKNTGRSKSDIVKESVSLYLWESRFQKLQRRISRKAKQSGIISEEDVFKAVS
jgi:predicted DNA-binding protein